MKPNTWMNFEVYSEKCLKTFTFTRPWELPLNLSFLTIQDLDAIESWKRKKKESFKRKLIFSFHLTITTNHLALHTRHCAKCISFIIISTFLTQFYDTGFFFFFFFFCFCWLHLWHMEVPRLRGNTQSELHLWPTP